MENSEVEEGEIFEANEVECPKSVSFRFFKEGKRNKGKICRFNLPNKKLYSSFVSSETQPFLDSFPYGPVEATEWDETLKEAQERVKKPSMNEEDSSVKKQIYVNIENDDDVVWCPKSPSLTVSFDSNFPEFSKNTKKKNKETKTTDTFPECKIVNHDRNRSSDLRKPSKMHPHRKRRLSSDTSSSISSEGSSSSRSRSKERSKKCHRSRSSSEEYSRKCRRSRPSSKEYSRKCRRSRPPSEERSKKCNRSRSSSRLRCKKRSSTSKHSKKEKRSPSWDRHRRQRRSSLKSDLSPSPVYVASYVSSSKRSSEKKHTTSSYKIKNRSPYELSMKKLLSQKQNNKLKETESSQKVALKKRAAFPNSEKIKPTSPTRTAQPRANLKRSDSDMSLSPLSDSTSKDVFETIENKYPKYDNEQPQDQNGVATKNAGRSLSIENQGKQFIDAPNTEKSFGSKSENIPCQTVIWSDEEESNENRSEVTAKTHLTHSEVSLKSKDAEMLEEKTSDQIEEELLEFRSNALLIFHPKNDAENSNSSVTRRSIDSKKMDAINKLSKQEKLEKRLAAIEVAIKRKRINSDI